MQSNEKKASLGKNGKKYNRSGRWKVLVACVVFLIAGGVLAKYITSNQQRAEMESSQFHISSNYLEEGDNASYAVADWGDGFDILLYNYEKENIAQISQVDMAYTVTAENATVTVKDQNDVKLIADSGSYQFNTKETTAYHVLHVTPDANAGKNGNIFITVQTTSPYRKELKAEFRIQNNNKPDYTITDQGDGTVLITVKTNDYQGSMTVKWNPAKFSPDNTNILMETWLDESATGNFTVGVHSTYELLFFKNGNDSYSQTTGSGTEIKLD